MTNAGNTNSGEEKARRLALEAAAGDRTAFVRLVEASFRTVANFHAKVAKDGAAAGRLTVATYRRIRRELPAYARNHGSQRWIAWLIEQCKETAFEGLPSHIYENSLAGSVKEMVAAPPRLEPLERYPSAAELYGRMTLDYQLLLELLFVEKLSFEEFVEIFPVSANMLIASVYSVFSALGELESLEHGEGCTTPPLPRWRQTLDSLIRGGSPDTSAAGGDEAACEACAEIARRTRLILSTLQTDLRPPVTPTPRTLSEISPDLAEAKEGGAGEKQGDAAAPEKISTFIPIPGRKVATVALWKRLVLPLSIGILLIVAASRFLRRPEGAPVLLRNRRGVHAPAWNDRPRAETIGTLTRTKGRPLPVSEGQRINTGYAAAAVRLREGTLLELGPRTEVTISRGKVVLHEGSLLAMRGEEGEPAALATRETECPLPSCLEAERRPGRHVVLYCLKGRTSVVVKLRDHPQERVELQAPEKLVVPLDGEEWKKFSWNDEEEGRDEVAASSGTGFGTKRRRLSRNPGRLPDSLLSNIRKVRTEGGKGGGFVSPYRHLPPELRKRGAGYRSFF